MGTRSFPKDFLWGTATASYQVEAAVTADGRLPGIWDTFSHTPGKTMHGQTGDTTVDQYNRYEEDVDLMRRMGAQSYRFSLAWPRIIPTGMGAVNQKGLDYYRRLADSLHSAGIQAAATLYHWDLPQVLQDAGGWPDRDTALRFADYAEVCFRELKDSVDMWITLNEPWCSSYLGYGIGIHAPGNTDMQDAYSAAHHLMVGHGLAVQRYRDAGLSAPIGITLNMDSPRPATLSPDDVAAAQRANEFKTLAFLNPLLGRPRPAGLAERRPQYVFPDRAGDAEVIASPIDFLGLNFYHEPAIEDVPVSVSPDRFREAHVYHEKTEMGWPITPRGFYRHIKWVWEETGGRWPLYITENGCAMPDELDEAGTACHDPRRISYLRDHFTAALDAIDEGVDLRGYFVWSLVDNFEWSWGISKRFGLIYIDYANNRRIPKDSYYYFREVISGSEHF